MTPSPCGPQVWAPGLSVADLRKQVRKWAPLDIDVREHTGNSLLNLVFCFGPLNWLVLARELLQRQVGLGRIIALYRRSSTSCQIY